MRPYLPESIYDLTELKYKQNWEEQCWKFEKWKELHVYGSYSKIIVYPSVSPLAMHQIHE